MISRKSNLTYVFFAVLLSIFVLGSSFGTTVQAQEDPDIAIVYPIVHPFFEGTTRGAKEAAEDYGANVKTYGPNSGQASEQITIMENLIAKDVDAIAIGVTEPTSLTPYINEAMDKGIPVVTFDTDASQSDRLVFISTDNFEAGKNAAREAVNLLKEKFGEPKGKIIISMGVPTQNNLLQRLDGFKQVISEYENIKIVDQQTGQGDPAKTTTNIENMLTAHPDADLLFGVDAQAGPSAVPIWQARGLDKFIVTFDDLPDILKGVREGIITVSIVQRQYEFGYLAVESLVKALNQKPLPVFMDTGTIRVTKNNIDKLKKLKKHTFKGE